MKKLIIIFVIFSSCSCTKWFEVQPQILLTITDCEGKIMPYQYIEYEDGKGTIRVTTDKRGQVKINDYEGKKIFIVVPSKNYWRTETVYPTITITVC